MPAEEWYHGVSVGGNSKEGGADYGVDDPFGGAQRVPGGFSMHLAYAPCHALIRPMRRALTRRVPALGAPGSRA